MLHSPLSTSLADYSWPLWALEIHCHCILGQEAAPALQALGEVGGGLLLYSKVFFFALCKLHMHRICTLHCLNLFLTIGSAHGHAHMQGWTWLNCSCHYLQWAKQDHFSKCFHWLDCGAEEGVMQMSAATDWVKISLDVWRWSCLDPEISIGWMCRRS